MTSTARMMLSSRKAINNAGRVGGGGDGVASGGLGANVVGFLVGVIFLRKSGVAWVWCELVADV
eukprot:417175-Prorocentrum_lima.AAC.1